MARRATLSVADISSTDISGVDVSARASWSMWECQRGGAMDETKDVTRPVDALLPLTPAVFQILLALTDGERHGYGIMREIAERAHGRMSMGPGTLYGSIKRMLDDGLIEESGTRPDPAMDDQRRRYYRLTTFGERVARAEAERLTGLVRAAWQKRLLPDRELEPTA